jgi:uncharacterized protein YjiK
MRSLICSFILLNVVVITLTGCYNNNSGKAPNDHKKKEKGDSVFNLTVREPSGLAFSVSKDALYVVSDKNGKIYKISLKGEEIEKLPFQGNDLEGIDVDKNNGEIWVAEERKQHILHLSSKGELINKITDIHVDTRNNSGFEGIAKNGDTLYILIEKDPGILIKYDILTRLWDKYKLDFAKDFSGIDYDTTDNTLWIVSDESETLNHCNMDGILISSQKIDVKQAEGVAVDRQKSIAWIVSDGGNSLHKIIIKE